MPSEQWREERAHAKPNKALSFVSWRADDTERGASINVKQL